MRDFNFFEPYIIQKESDVPKEKLIFYIGILILSIIAVIYPLLNVFQQQRISKSITTMQTILHSDETYEKIQRIEEKQQKIEMAVAKASALTQIEEQLKKEAFIDDYLMHAITGTIPQDIFFEKLSFSSNTVEMQGYATSKDKIALLEQRLNKIPDFQEIFIPSISREESFYRFTLTFTMKDVTVHEANQ